MREFSELRPRAGKRWRHDARKPPSRWMGQGKLRSTAEWSEVTSYVSEQTVINTSGASQVPRSCIQATHQERRIASLEVAPLRIRREHGPPGALVYRGKPDVGSCEG